MECSDTQALPLSLEPPGPGEQKCQRASIQALRDHRRDIAQQDAEAKATKERVKREKDERRKQEQADRQATIAAKIMEGRAPTRHTGKEAQLALEDEYAKVDGILVARMRLQNLRDMWKVLQLMGYTRLAYVD
ncbi:hypothetical protein LTR78_010808 [Recurvomyces mirabilis]|uniref:Uncharacterized protein n=1 Tax=Recurvomyces mirabilis TaxID=574656 RepID=A0AAE0WG22_9PEZI|nr:hypothetical protein LTR78_010808 [Recurvomyces mirabilis]KAK5156327.1 hypothetical protein LTS14_005215 [Recurvomyces mirabilis]